MKTTITNNSNKIIQVKDPTGTPDIGPGEVGPDIVGRSVKIEQKSNQPPTPPLSGTAGIVVFNDESSTIFVTATNCNPQGKQEIGPGNSRAFATRNGLNSDISGKDND